MLNCIGGAKEIDVSNSKHLSSPAWMFDNGKYGPRGEIQAPACTSFLFRPSLPLHWLQACRLSEMEPKHRR